MRTVHDRLLLALVALLFLAAPTPGDIGCANSPPLDLDPNKFFLAKQQDDCAACTACNFTTQACARACGAPMGGSFPNQCYPLIRDGDVCLDALEAATCADYASYVADQGATTPTECDFCPPRDAGPE
jgi:hypothetical protein